MRNRAIDAMRFAAVSAVVLQHAILMSARSGNTSALAILGLSMWAVPLLFGASGCLSTLGRKPIDLARRLRRLLVPYVIWSVVLLAYAAQGALRAGTSPGPINWFGVVFAGEAFYTLWFLAMLVYATLAGWALRTDRARLIGAGACLTAYVAIAVVRFDRPVLDTATLGGFVLIAPLCIGAYLAGAALPGLRPHATLRRSGSHRVLIGTALLALCADAVLYAMWGADLLQCQQCVIFGLGTVAALRAVSMSLEATADEAEKPSRITEWAAWAGTFSLGIYIIHAPMLNVVRLVTNTRDSVSVVWALALTMITTALSLAGSYAIARANTRLERLVR